MKAALMVMLIIACRIMSGFTPIRKDEAVEIGLEDIAGHPGPRSGS